MSTLLYKIILPENTMNVIVISSEVVTFDLRDLFPWVIIGYLTTMKIHIKLLLIFFYCACLFKKMYATNTKLQVCYGLKLEM